MRGRLTHGTAFALVISTLVIACSVDAPRVSAQSGTSDSEKAAGGKMSFEVASVKLNNSHTFAMRFQFLKGGGLVAENCPLRFLIMKAYDIPPSQILGGPNFGADADRYDIDAEASESSQSNQIAREMLQSLLETRFQLKTHWTTRDRQVYELTVDKGGPRIKRSAEGSCVLSAGTPTQSQVKPTDSVVCGSPVDKVEGPDHQLEMAGATMNGFAMFLATTELRTVTDRTGLSGMYDVTLRWTRCPALGPVATADSDMPTTGPDCNGGTPLVTAVREQLGLKLESTKGPVQVLVIDHIERPTPN